MSWTGARAHIYVLLSSNKPEVEETHHRVVVSLRENQLPGDDGRRSYCLDVHHS
jgi:hypothetical protein